MLKIFKVLLMLFGLLFLFYLILPQPDFPLPPPDSLRSKEFADVESPLRRAYFTNSTREEVIDWYKNQFEKSPFKGISLWTLRLNYPPEDSQTLIRDQTRSTFLEELVHPFRESIYINGFEPKDPKDAIEIEGRPWRQKIIIKYIEGRVFTRVLLLFPTLILIWLILKEYFKEFKRNV